MLQTLPLCLQERDEYANTRSDEMSSVSSDLRELIASLLWHRVDRHKLTSILKSGATGGSCENADAGASISGICCCTWSHCLWKANGRGLAWSAMTSSQYYNFKIKMFFCCFLVFNFEWYANYSIISPHSICLSTKCPHNAHAVSRDSFLFLFNFI